MNFEVAITSPESGLGQPNLSLTACRTGSRHSRSVPLEAYPRPVPWTETRNCTYCGEEFRATIRSGPPPQYCSHAHRQRAYEQRRRTDDPARIRELEAMVRRLESDNRKLRQALADAEAHALRLDAELHPRPPDREDRFGINPSAAPEPPEPGPGWRRGGRTTT